MLPPTKALTCGAVVACAIDAPTCRPPAPTPNALAAAFGAAFATTLTESRVWIVPPPVLAWTDGAAPAVAVEPEPARMPPAKAWLVALARSIASACTVRLSASDGPAPCCTAPSTRALTEALACALASLLPTARNPAATPDVSLSERLAELAVTVTSPEAESVVPAPTRDSSAGLTRAEALAPAPAAPSAAATDVATASVLIWSSDCVVRLMVAPRRRALSALARMVLVTLLSAIDAPTDAPTMPTDTASEPTVERMLAFSVACSEIAPAATRSPGLAALSPLAKLAIVLWTALLEDAPPPENPPPSPTATDTELAQDIASIVDSARALTRMSAADVMVERSE